MMVLVAHPFRRSWPLKVGSWFRRLLLESAGLYSPGHGGNDAQKTIGIIWMLLIATGYAAADGTLPPGWTILACYIVIGLGAMFGGWRIVKTMGRAPCPGGSLGRGSQHRLGVALHDPRLGTCCGPVLPGELLALHLTATSDRTAARRLLFRSGLARRMASSV